MPRTILLHHPDLDRTVECRPAQARVLAQSGWQRVGQPPDPPDDADPVSDDTADADTTTDEE